MLSDIQPSWQAWTSRGFEIFQMKNWPIKRLSRAKLLAKTRKRSCSDGPSSRWSGRRYSTDSTAKTEYVCDQEQEKALQQQLLPITWLSYKKERSVRVQGHFGAKLSLWTAHCTLQLALLYIAERWLLLAYQLKPSSSSHQVLKPSRPLISTQARGWAPQTSQ